MSKHDFKLTANRYVRPSVLPCWNPRIVEVQTRREDGSLNYYDTAKEAFNVAAKDDTVWKISFALSNGERIRMVREGDKFFYESVVPQIEKDLL